MFRHYFWFNSEYLETTVKNESEKKMTYNGMEFALSYVKSLIVDDGQLVTIHILHCSHCTKHGRHWVPS